MSQTQVTIEIDGKKVQARSGAMVIEAADELGIKIPRFCYHKKLSIAANCRMCLVEVEKAAKPLPACATPVTEGMRIFTQSRKALEAQKAVMEFLLINHPLDCPICDQGGECELQDVAMGYGRDISRYGENKRVVADKNLGPLIATDMTRCIHCTRCVRFGDEIAGLRELGATGRGEHMEIGTYIENAVGSELSGNVIDLCPVGALTSKPFRFSARAWEMRQHPSIAPHDCIGSNIFVHIAKNKVLRVVPRDNEAVNETWISDRDRYSYEGLNSVDRLRAPMIKQDGQWREVDWTTALDFTVSGLQKVIAQHGAQQLGALCSPSSTLEEMYLLQKALRALGSSNLDHRLRQLDFSDQDQAPLYPWLGQSIEHLEQVDAALLIGSNVRKDQPLAGHRLRKAALAGARMMFINPLDYDFRFNVAQKIITDPRRMVLELGAVAKALTQLAGVKAPAGFGDLFKSVTISTTHQAIAQHLKDARNATVLLGLGACAHAEFSALRSLASLIAQLTDAKLGILSDGANAAGAWLAGMLPHRGPAGVKVDVSGQHAAAMCKAGLKGFVLLGVEPDVDLSYGRNALAELRAAQFTVLLSPYRNAALEQTAQVLLPIAPFTETSGTFVNAEGRWQSFTGAVAPLADARPAWKVLRVLGNLLQIPGFDYVTSEEVRDELHALVGNARADNKATGRGPVRAAGQVVGVARIADVPLYALDATVRRAGALQKTAD
ncbi:MAG: NADH-quinone oxidoreductase subunit G, partial [Gammaproteobacteria bacterium]|nr:NADH-quinone oxidoreductase subunit G [Gammaproteobacteria bacterium]